MLTNLLDSLTIKARALGLNDAEWARRAGLRKETLSRLRRRRDCDLSTLQALASQIGATLALGDAPPAPANDLFPLSIDREEEARLLTLAARGPRDLATWRCAGTPAFMAGLAVMLASERGQNRGRWLELAERLRPSASEPAVFSHWLNHSPLRPSRFLPMLQMERRHAG